MWYWILLSLNPLTWLRVYTVELAQDPSLVFNNVHSTNAVWREHVRRSREPVVIKPREH